MYCHTVHHRTTFYVTEEVNHDNTYLPCFSKPCVFAGAADWLKMLPLLARRYLMCDACQNDKYIV